LLTVLVLSESREATQEGPARVASLDLSRSLMLKKAESFVGRGFSRDAKPAKSVGLQPLKFLQISFSGC